MLLVTDGSCALQSANLLSLFQIGENVFFSRSNVRPNRRYRFLDVPAFHSFKNSQVFLIGRQAACLVIEAVGSSLQNNTFEELSKNFCKRFVTRGASDFQVDLLIINQSLPRKPFLHVGAIHLHLFGDAVERRIRQFLHGFFNAKRLQSLSDVIELFGLLQSNFSTGKTAVRQKGDLPFLNQSGQSFADRSSAHAKALAQFLVMEFLTRQNRIT